LCLFDKTFQFAASGGVSKFSQSLCFYLPDPFAGYRKILPDLFEGMVSLFADSKPHAQYLLLAWRQCCKNLSGLFGKIKTYSSI